MASADAHHEPTKRDGYEGSLDGSQDRPFLPRLRSDSPAFRPLPRNLLEFRELEGQAERERRFREIWARIPKSRSRWTDHDHDHEHSSGSGSSEDSGRVGGHADLSQQRAKELSKIYEDELLGQFNGQLGSIGGQTNWTEFVKYAETKEAELWHIFHDELDLDGNGHLDSHELQTALSRAGIRLESATLAEFMTSLTSSPHSHAISFAEFRDFLLLLPRKASTEEIYRYYEVQRSLRGERHGAARVTMEGDVTLSAEDRPLPHPKSPTRLKDPSLLPIDHSLEPSEGSEGEHDAADLEEHQHYFGGMTALKFLLAGGVAGAVSRTATAPFDRLKIFLMTRSPDLGGTPIASIGGKAGTAGAKAIANAVARIYAEGGVLGFWIGNGLSVAKIFPESAIKFLSYESAKTMFAQYYDHVDDTRDISGVSRFMSGGIGGITSQLSIYPIETLKTQMMSSTGEQKQTLKEAARHLWQLGGMRAYYRGLTIGLIGVFPYAAIDMSTFEALKLAYLKSTGKDEPGVMATLAFGSVSGSVGATTVYPLNLVRTRLQASGSSGHPERYTGMWDVTTKTFQRDGWRGFYRGLIPTLAKVVPAVSISYVVYESSKRKLGV